MNSIESTACGGGGEAVVRGVSRSVAVFTWFWFGLGFYGLFFLSFLCNLVAVRVSFRM